MQEKDSTLIFQRSQSPIKNICRFLRNDIGLIRRINITFTLAVFLTLLGGVFLLLLWMLRPVLWVMGISALCVIVFEIILYFLVSRTSKVFNLQSISLDENKITISYRDSSREEIVFYQSIERLSYSGGYTYIITGGKLFYWLRHYIVVSRDDIGKDKKILIPLDLPNLKYFLKIVTEKAGLVKASSYKLGLFYEWRKHSLVEKQTRRKEQSPYVVNPNANIGKALLIVIVCVVIICYIIIKVFFQ